MSDLIERQAAIEAVGLNTWAGSRISTLPTAKAISIEWLKKKAQEFAERYWSKQDDHKKLILPMVDCPIVIEQMIKEWGYESATD